MYALAGLSPATTKRLQAALPRCYSMEFHRDCVEEANPGGYPGCRDVIDAYAEDFDATEQQIDALPYCSERSAALDRVMFATGGLLAGLLIGVLVS